MMCINRFKLCSRVILLLHSFFMMVLMQPAIALEPGCQETLNSNYNLVVDAASSCQSLSSKFFGCETDANGQCVIPNPTGGDPIVIQVTPADAVGSIPVPPDLVSWQVISAPAALEGKAVDFVFELGATADGTCAWDYFPGKNSDTGLGFLKSNGNYQKVNAIFVCSDFAAPPPALATLLVKKTVMPSGGACGVDDVEVLEINQGDDVEYCVTIENVGAGEAGNVILSDPDAFASDQLLGTIAAGAPITTVKSSPVTVSTTGELINTATVTWDNNEDPAGSTGSASDIAKLISRVAVEACPSDYQTVVDGTIGNEDDFKFAAIYDPQETNRVALCAQGQTAGRQCIDDLCVLKEICETDPENFECVAPYYHCEQSGNWSVGKPGDCVDNSGSGGVPYCWELRADRDRNCEYKPIRKLKTHILKIDQTHENPFCYYSTAFNIDGSSYTVEHCFPPQ